MALTIPGFRKPAHAPRPRGDARHDVETVSCELGRLIDLSRSGMRLQSDGPTPVAPGQVLTLHLEHRQGATDVTALVRWRRRKGWRRFELGLQFTALPEGKRDALEQLARFGFMAPKAAATARHGEPRPPVHASITLPDYYRILGVSEHANPEEIRRAFHEQVKVHHPDAGGDGQQFVEIHRAWETLQDHATRRSYDRARRRSA